MLKNIFSFLAIVVLTGCAVTSPYKVSKEDAQRSLATDLGTIIDVVPVKIKGDPSTVGAIAGGLIGGIAAEKIGSGSGQEIAVIAGTVAGGVIGYYSTVKLGEHNGYQYSIAIDDENSPIAIIQGEDKNDKFNFEVGDRVSIIYGAQVRVLPSNN
jgi:outer membrane lipoprotein SlyB